MSTSRSSATASTPWRAGEEDGEDRLVGVHGTGLGILRADQRQSADAGRLPQKVSEHARRRQLLVITKANSRSTVHRPAYLDYVGVKTFDEDGEVNGERRFLGLFTSAAYNESIQRIPVLRRKAAEVLARSGFPSNSHSGKDLLQILETYPRDELFQISVDDLEEIVLSVLHLQERRQLRLFLRRDDYGRFMSCMVYLPRDRYTTQVRQAMEEILLDEFDGISVDYTALVSESVLARLHFVVRDRAGCRRRRRRPGRRGGQAGRGHPVLGGRLLRRPARQLRRGAGRSSSRRRTPRRSPRRTRRTCPRRRRSRTCTGSRRSRWAATST